MFIMCSVDAVSSIPYVVTGNQTPTGTLNDTGCPTIVYIPLRSLERENMRRKQVLFLYGDLRRPGFYSSLCVFGPELGIGIRFRLTRMVFSRNRSTRVPALAILKQTR